MSLIEILENLKKLEMVSGGLEIKSLESCQDYPYHLWSFRESDNSIHIKWEFFEKYDL